MDNSVKNIQTFFTEGFTELLSFYLTYQVIKSYYNSQSKRLYSNGKVVTLVDLEKYYLPMLSDLKHLKKFRNIEDSIKDFESTPKGSHIVGWKNSGYYINLYVLFYILQKIGIEFGIDCFYNNNFEKFNQKCVSVFGYNWIKVTDFIKLDRNLSDFKIVANILKLLEGR